MKRPPEIVITGLGPEDAREYTLVALDSANHEKVFALAKRIADRTGRTVRVQDSDAGLFGTFRTATKN